MSDDATRASGTHTAEHEAEAAAFALHALDHDEETAFAEHLETCSICRRTVDETLETLGDVAGAVEPVAPPPGLRARLLDAVAAEGDAVSDAPTGDARAGDIPAGDASAGDVPVGDASVGDASVGDVPPTLRSASRRVAPEEREAPAPARAPAPAPARHRAAPSADVVSLRRRRATRWLAAAAAVVVLAAVGGLAAVTQALRTERDAAAAQARRDAVVVDVLRDAGRPGTVHATLEDPQGALVGMVVDDGAGPRVLTTDLGANTAEQIYVLWGLADGAPRPLGAFDVTQQAPAVHSVPSSAEGVSYAGFAVSLEPGRTAPASPTRVVASGQVGR